MIGNMKLYYRIIIRDSKTGKIIRKTRMCKSKSFLLQFLDYINCLLEHPYPLGGTQISVKNTADAARNITMDAQNRNNFCAMNAPVDDDSYGIVVGTGNTAPTNTDVALETQIAHGAGAGQLTHGAHNWTAAAVVGVNVDMIVQRPFINNSGGAITIEECGMYVKTRDDALTVQVFCIARDVSGGVAVADGQTATVEYTFRTTV